MAKPLSHSAQSELLINFKQAVQKRVESETVLEQQFGEASLAQAEQYRQAIQHSQGEHQFRTEELRTQFETQCTQINTNFDAQKVEVEQEFESRKNEAIRNQAKEREEADEKQQEAEWMVKSMFDDQSDDSPKLKFEQFKSSLEKGQEQFKTDKELLTQLTEQATNVVGAWGVKPAEEVTPTEGLKASSLDEARDLFRSNFDTVDNSLTKLKQNYLASLCSSWKPFVLLALVAGGVFALLYFVINPVWLGLSIVPGSEDWMMYTGGAAAGVGLLIVGAFYFTVMGKVKNTFYNLQQSGVNCQYAQRLWVKHGKAALEREKKEYVRAYKEIQKQRQIALKKVEQQHQQRLQEIEDSQQALLQKLEQTYTPKLAHIEESRQAEIDKAGAEFHQYQQEMTSNFKANYGGLEAQQNAYLQAQQQAEQQTRGEMTSSWQAELSRLDSSVTEMQNQSDAETPQWELLTNSDWQLPTEIPQAIRMGEMHFDMADVDEAISVDSTLVPQKTDYKIPLVLPFPNDTSLFLKTNVDCRKQGAEIMQSVMLRLLSTLPAGKVRFTIIDPMGLGEDFSSFMHLADYDELMINNRIWTEPGHIDARLSEITEHMENVFQTYLRNEYETIEDYNHFAGEVAEPYRILVVANFPYNFNDTAAKRLLSIASSGPRCGVYTMISVDTKQKLPHGFDVDELEKCSTTLEWRDDRFRLAVPELEHLDLSFLAPPEPQLYGQIVRRLGDLSKNARRVEVSFERVVPANNQLWEEDSKAGLNVALGRAGATKLQYMNLGKGTSQHVLIAGKTGSGKSTFLHILITNLALHYSPEQVQLYLIDFKKGVEFKTYAAHKLPHAKVIAIESDREFGVSVLEKLDDLLKERGDLFRDNNVQDLAGFRKACPDVVMPRVMLVVDEFQEYFVEDDNLAQNATLLLDRLVRQGRAFGIHVLLGSQTLGGAYSLARSTLGQVAVRIALQCSESDAHLILSEDNTAARLLTRPGEAIYNDANGLLEGNHPFQIAWLGDDTRDKYLGMIAQKVQAENREYEPPIVFEGNIASDPARNEEVTNLVIARASDRTPAFPRFYKTWMGEAVAITDPSFCEFRKQSGNHLLMVGAQPDSARGILATGIISLAAQLPTSWPEETFTTTSSTEEVETTEQNKEKDPFSSFPAFPGSTNTEEAKESTTDSLDVDSTDEDSGVPSMFQSKTPSMFGGGSDSPFSSSIDSSSETETDTTPDKAAATFYILDGDYDEAPETTRWEELLPAIPHRTELGGVSAANGYLEEIAKHVSWRNKAADTKGMPPIFLVIYHLGRFRELRKAEDDFSFGSSRSSGPLTGADHLSTIIKEGPAVGIHVMLWCDSFSNVTRWLSSQLLREMETRIAFDMNATDSSNFIDSPVASRLGTHRAYFYQEDQGRLDKFRPYGFPSEAWLAWVASYLDPTLEPMAELPIVEEEPPETMKQPTIIEAEKVTSSDENGEQSSITEVEQTSSGSTTEEMTAPVEVVESVQSAEETTETEVEKTADKPSSSSSKKEDDDDDHFDLSDDLDLWSIS